MKTRFGLLLLACLLLVCAVAAVGGCTDPVDAAQNVAEACGDQPCPVGTAFTEIRSISAGYDIGLGYDPASYSASGAFKRFGEGDCEYACQVINACPDGTFPVITADCFTCGTLNAAGEVQQGTCQL